MEFTGENILFISSLILILSILASKTTGRFGVPSLLIFLGIGILAGSDGLGGIAFDNVAIAQFIGNTALIFILFSGGLNTSWKAVEPHLLKGLSLSTIGVFVTAVLVGLIVHWLTPLDLMQSLLLGSIVSSTDAAAVFSILRSKNVRLQKPLQEVLELESGSNDPMAFLLTIGMTSFIQNPETTGWTFLLIFLKQMIIGSLAGWMLGRLMVWTLNKINLDFEGLYPVTSLSIVLLAFSVTSYLGGNGFLAVYLIGLLAGKHNFIHKKSLSRFYDGQSWLMSIVMFVVLGLLVFPKQIIPLIPIGLLVAVILIVIARPVAVYVSLLFFRMSNRHRLFISWVGLRGAVPIVFATYPMIAGVEHSDILFNLVFFIVLVSVTIQGTTIPLFARLLKVVGPLEQLSDPEKKRTIDQEIHDALIELNIDSGAEAVGKRIVELGFPKNALIVLINRNGKYITPNGATEILSGDRLFVMTNQEDDLQVVKDTLGIH